MQILKPLGNQVAEKVKNWKEIRKDAQELKALINAGDYDGHWRDAYAISHVQVSRQPKDFFVLNELKTKVFGSWCVVNLKIIKQSGPCTYPEGCMSFMFREMKRVDRFDKITVTYWTPFLDLFLIPHRKTFKDLDAFICQHEFDHAQGKNIYGL